MGEVLSTDRNVAPILVSSAAPGRVIWEWREFGGRELEDILNLPTTKKHRGVQSCHRESVDVSIVICRVKYPVTCLLTGEIGCGFDVTANFVCVVRRREH